jgi:hypothetical protein
MSDTDDLRVCPLCGQNVEPHLVDPILLVEDAVTPESLQRHGFLVHENCLLDATRPGLRDRVAGRLAAARAADRPIM